MQREEEENASLSDNDNEFLLVNESILSDNSTVIVSKSEIVPLQLSTSSFTATCSTISSFSIDIDLEMPPSIYFQCCEINL